MAFIIADRVRETSTTSGLGNITLEGAQPGARRFGDRMAVGDTTWYAITGSGGSWETGVGTYVAANTMERTTPLESSNGDARVNFAAGTKDVFMTVPAKRSFDPVAAADASKLTRGAFAGWGLAPGAAELNLGIRQVEDFNALPYESGLWSCDIMQVPNGPGLSGVVVQLCRGNQRRTQTFYSDLSNRVMMRAFTSAGWTPWIPVTPERGSNANGDWVKFADGTMQCSIPLIALTGGGSATISATWTFPTPFSVSPVVLFQPTNAPPVNTRERSEWITNLGTGSVSLNLSMNASWPASSSVNAQAFATGRWY